MPHSRFLMAYVLRGQIEITDKKIASGLSYALITYPSLLSDLLSAS